MITLCMMKAEISQENCTQSVPRCYVAPKILFSLDGLLRQKKKKKLKWGDKEGSKASSNNNESAQRPVIAPGSLWSVYAPRE